MKTILAFTLVALAGLSLTSGAQPVQPQPEQEPGQPNPVQAPVFQPTPAPSTTTLPSPATPLPFQRPAPLPSPTSPVKPVPAPTDADVTSRVRTAITTAPLASNGKPALAATGIAVTDLNITTTKNTVTLRGSVHSEKERNEAGARAAAAAGGATVINELSIR